MITIIGDVIIVIVVEKNMVIYSDILNAHFKEFLQHRWEPIMYKVSKQLVHYIAITWASLRLKWPSMWLFVQEFVPTNIKQNTSESLVLCVRNTLVTDGIPAQRAGNAKSISM